MKQCTRPAHHCTEKIIPGNYEVVASLSDEQMLTESWYRQDIFYEQHITSPGITKAPSADGGCVVSGKQ